MVRNAIRDALGGMGFEIVRHDQYEGGEEKPDLTISCPVTGSLLAVEVKARKEKCSLSYISEVLSALRRDNTTHSGHLVVVKLDRRPPVVILPLAQWIQSLGYSEFPDCRKADVADEIPGVCDEDHGRP